MDIISLGLGVHSTSHLVTAVPLTPDTPQAIAWIRTAVPPGGLQVADAFHFSGRL